MKRTKNMFCILLLLVFLTGCETSVSSRWENDGLISTPDHITATPSDGYIYENKEATQKIADQLTYLSSDEATPPEAYFTIPDTIQVYDISKIDFDTPPPDYDAALHSADYRTAWIQFLEKQHVKIGDYYVFLGATPPNHDMKTSQQTGSRAETWIEFLSKPSEEIEQILPHEEDVPNIKVPFIAAHMYNRFPIDLWEHYYANYVNLARIRGIPFLWGNWIVDTMYPPPGYEPEIDPWLPFGCSPEWVEKERDDTYCDYGDCWIAFFDDMPEIQLLP